jgi:hypothetical protein
MNTMFPALRAAKAIDLVLKNVVVTDTNNVQHMSCDIYLAGSKLGSFVDHGNGGCGHFSVIRSDAEILYAQMRKANLPVLPNDKAEAMMIGPYAESALINLICETSMLKTFKKYCKKHTVIVFKDTMQGEYSKYPHPFTSENRSAAVAKLGSRIAYFVNEDITSLEAA